jgi:hypothetical protein
MIPPDLRQLRFLSFQALLQFVDLMASDSCLLGDWAGEAGAGGRAGAAVRNGAAAAWSCQDKRRFSFIR